MTADLVKCLSLSAPILLTDDSRLGQISVPLCVTHTNFEKCGAVVAFNVWYAADTSGDPKASIINSTFSDGKDIRIHHNSGICTRIHGVTGLFIYPMVWFAVSHQVHQMICCWLNMRWTTYANISTANLHNEYLQFSHRDINLSCCQSHLLLYWQTATVQASWHHPGSWWMDWGKRFVSWDMNQSAAKHTSDVSPLEPAGYDDFKACGIRCCVTDPLKPHKPLTQQQCHGPVDLSDLRSDTPPRSHSVDHTSVRGTTSVSFVAADTRPWN